MARDLSHAALGRQSGGAGAGQGCPCHLLKKAMRSRGIRVLGREWGAAPNALPAAACPHSLPTCFQGPAIPPGFSSAPHLCHGHCALRNPWGCGGWGTWLSFLSPASGSCVAPLLRFPMWKTMSSLPPPCRAVGRGLQRSGRLHRIGRCCLQLAHLISTTAPGPRSRLPDLNPATLVTASSTHLECVPRCTWLHRRGFPAQSLPLQSPALLPETVQGSVPQPLPPVDSRNPGATHLSLVYSL